MDRFPDGIHVRLRSRERGVYLSADEDGRSVSLTTRHGSLNAAWRVHLTESGGRTYVRLLSSAYGRYLAVSPRLSPHGHRGTEAVQGDYRHPEQLNIGWTAIAAKDESGDVLLRSLLNGCCLRANAREGRWKSCSCVTVDAGPSTMMHWTVEYIGRRPVPPSLPTPHAHEAKLCRKIMYVQAYDDGTYNRSGWKTMPFEGRSVQKLMLSIREEEQISLNITLCVRAGPYGQLAPLVTDLPHSEETLNVILVTSGTPAWSSLVYPDIPALQSVMELFTEEGFIRIKSGGRYLLADEGGMRVWMSKELICAQQVWIVQLAKNNYGETLILLRGAAYGRYLATEPNIDEPEGPGTLVQCAYEEPGQQNLLWKVNSLEGSFEVQLRSANSAAKLTVRCTIEKIQASPIPPRVMPAEPPEENGVYHGNCQGYTDRTIWYTVGDKFNPQQPWKMCAGKSLSELQSLLLPEDGSYVLCIRAGPSGRWTPLFTELPQSTDALEILVLNATSRDVEPLMYPALVTPEA